MSEDGQPDEAKEWEDYEHSDLEAMYGENDVNYILNQYGKWYNFNAALAEGVPCLCGKDLTLSNTEIEMYEHSDGIYVPNKVKKQWVYVTCNFCDYQNSHEKIFMRMKRKK